MNRSDLKQFFQLGLRLDSGSNPPERAQLYYICYMVVVSLRRVARNKTRSGWRTGRRQHDAIGRFLSLTIQPQG
jgi:hypothetical protein